jgi:tetratricopeptide (TPR) repeat protein
MAKETPLDEDSLIMQGLMRDEASDYRSAQEIFERLYRLTDNPEYLIQAAREAMMPGGDPERAIPLLEKWVSTRAAAGGKMAPVRLLVALYAKKGELERAEPLADRWLAHSEDPVDLKLAATLKGDLGKYREAVKLLQKAYEKSGDEKLLLDEVTLLEKRLGERKEAIRLLETRLRMNPESSLGTYFKLIELYAKENDLKKVRELYEKLYEKTPENYILQKIVKLGLYTKDYDGLIRFLRKHAKGNEELLYMLYKEQGRYDKAIALAHQRYKETGKPRWLAEEAILLYEKARAERRVTPALLKTFRSLFDRALKEGAEDGLYLNYYGYTLIDHDLDVARGLELVRRALKLQPDNPYYLDSLAWGLYKEGRCAEAAKVMEKVVAGDGLREPEIRMHLESIRQCLSRGSGSR